MRYLRRLTNHWFAPSNPVRLYVRPTWGGEGGVRALLIISTPLILGGLSAVVNLFFDRYYLAQYDLQHHMPASLSGGVAWWTMQHLPLGIVGYAATFAAQYHGARRDDRVGGVLCQALYIALVGGLINLVALPFWGPFFHAIHSPELASLEAVYCEGLTIGAFFLMFQSAFGAIYSGLGRTRFVMVVNFVVAGSNILLNRWLIFSPPSWLPFIEPGISGAAWGTNISFAIGASIFLVDALTDRMDERFHTRRSWRFRPALMARLLRFGAPQGIFQIVEVSSFSFVLLMVGRVDEQALIASNIAFTTNMVVFMPMLMLGHGLGIMAGHFIGHGSPGKAEKTVFETLIINVSFMALISVFYVFTPNVFLIIFTPHENAAALTPEIGNMARWFLLLVAVYSIGDAVGVTFASAIRGAGDTKFILGTCVICSISIIFIPGAIVTWLDIPATVLWMLLLVYLFVTAASYFLRYRSGRWKSMRVIEPDLVRTEAA